MTMTLSIRTLRVSEACHLDRRISDLQRTLDRVVRRDEEIPLKAWFDLDSTTLGDAIWVTGVILDRLDVAVEVARLAADRSGCPCADAAADAAAEASERFAIHAAEADEANAKYVAAKEDGADYRERIEYAVRAGRADDNAANAVRISVAYAAAAAEAADFASAAAADFASADADAELAAQWADLYRLLELETL